MWEVFFVGDEAFLQVFVGNLGKIGLEWLFLVHFVCLGGVSAWQRPGKTQQQLASPWVPCNLLGHRILLLHLNDLPDTQPEGLLLLALGFFIQIWTEFVLEPARSQQKGAHALEEPYTECSWHPESNRLHQKE